MIKGQLRVVLFQENGAWIAQCLEHDIATQGTKIQDALDALERTILGQISLDAQDGIKPLSDIAPAPAQFIDAFEKAYRVCDKRTFQTSQAVSSQPIMAETAIAA